MELNINNNHTEISTFSNELNSFLETNIEGATFSINRIEDKIAVCENRENKKMINIHLSKLPLNIKENDIIKYINGVYILSKQETNSTKENIKEKFNKLRKK